LLLGWAAGTAIGTYMAAMQDFTSSVYPLQVGNLTIPGYAALYSVLANFLVAAALTPVFDLLVRRRAVFPAE
jgi:solute:Na+ symporter, SSS family